MTKPYEELVGLDKLIHEPARLAIMTALSACDNADFTFLQQLTGLTKGNLSSHLAKLELGGLVTIEKRFVKKMPNTLISLTDKGSLAIEHHWQLLEKLRNGTKL